MTSRALGDALHDRDEDTACPSCGGWHSRSDDRLGGVEAIGQSQRAFPDGSDKVERHAFAQSRHFKSLGKKERDDDEPDDFGRHGGGRLGKCQCLGQNGSREAEERRGACRQRLKH